MPNSTSNKFAAEQKQSLFTAIAKSDADFREAYAAASRTLPRFIEHFQRGIPAYFSANLRFRDPDESKRLGEDIFDWMVLSEDGRLFGGFTLRVSPSKLPESERADYDRYVGVRVYEPAASPRARVSSLGAGIRPRLP